MSKKQKKQSYAILRSGFGDLWVGKVELEPDGNSIFANFDDAMEKAKQLNDSIKNAEELDDTTEEDLEVLRPDMHKWIIKK